MFSKHITNAEKLISNLKHVSVPGSCITDSYMNWHRTWPLFLTQCLEISLDFLVFLQYYDWLENVLKYS